MRSRSISGFTTRLCTNLSTCSQHIGTLVAVRF